MIEKHPSLRLATYEDAAAIAAVHISSWRTTYVGIVPDSYLNGLTLQQKIKSWQQNLNQPMASETWLACIDTEVIGFGSWGRNRDSNLHHQGELYALYLVATHQGKGIGTHLFRQFQRYLSISAFNSACIWSLKDNKKAHKAYESWGAQAAPDYTKDIMLDGVNLIEILHEWKTNS